MNNENSSPETKQTLDINAIMDILPHRYPFLFIDRVTEIVRKQRIVAWKNVTINEPFFEGHFPGFPIMPGVLVVEAAAQAGGALLLTEFPDRAERLMVFTGIERAKFRRPVVPGDQLRIEVTVRNWRTYAVKLEAQVTIEGKVACEVTLMCQLIPRQKKVAEPVSESVAAAVEPRTSEPVTSE